MRRLVIAMLGLLAAPALAAPAPPAEDMHDRLRIAAEIDRACAKFGFFEQYWMRRATGRLFSGSAAEARIAAARKAEPVTGAAKAKQQLADGYAARAKALGCGKETDGYVLDAVLAGWIDVGVALQTSVQLDALAGQYRRPMTDEQKRLGASVLATMRNRLGTRQGAVEARIDERMRALAPVRAQGMANPATAPATYLEMAFTADPLFSSTRFVQAMSAAGYVPREVPLGDEEPGIVLTPTKPGGKRYFALGLPSDLRIPTGAGKSIPASGMLALDDGGNLLIALIDPPAAALPANLRAVLTARHGNPARAERLAADCPGTQCFAFRAADHEKQAGFGSTSHDAMITARDLDYPTEGAGEALTARTARLKSARTALATLKP